MANGKLHVIIADTLPLEEMAELHAIGEAGGPMAKLVVTVN